MKLSEKILTEDSQTPWRNSTTASPYVLLIDLNNQSRYPTLPVGIMTAILRKAGHKVELLTPLAVGISGTLRDQRAKSWNYWDERLRWWSALTPIPTVRILRKLARNLLDGSSTNSTTSRILAEFEEKLQKKPDVILISAYYMYENVVRKIAKRCINTDIPIIIGGPGFTNVSATESWLNMNGITALVAGECEPFIVKLVEYAHLRKDLSDIPGCSIPGSFPAQPAPPLENLDDLPFPDYDDVPWDRYPNRIITIITGRGCGWGVCSFCSDVKSVNGRSFRSRSAKNVLAELAYHNKRYGVRLFHFSDLKINSNVKLWRDLIDGFQDSVPNGLWTCSVHVGNKGDQGLSFEDLCNARKSGLVRITTGVETGSQRLLDSMAKGVTTSNISNFLNNAHNAGISVRITMFTGYPGETYADLDSSVSLLEKHIDDIDRVLLSRFVIHPMTPISRAIEKNPEQFPELKISFNSTYTEIIHSDLRINQRKYRRSINKLLRIVHKINHRPLPKFAQDLEGAM